MRWPKFSKASLDRACQEFQSTRCTSSSSMSKIQSTRYTSSPSMSRIPINEVYSVSKHGKNSNQRGVLVSKHGKNGKNSNQRGVLRLQACQEFQSTRCTSFQSTSCTSSPIMSRIPINEVYFVSEVYPLLQTKQL